MKDDSLLQFVCFDTPMEPGEFFPRWENLMSGVRKKSKTPDTLYKVMSKSRFTYISQHECAQDDFHFAFKKDGRMDRLREARVKVILAGGYTPLKIGNKFQEGDDVFKIMAFSTDHTTPVSAFEKLKPYNSLNIYQAYYENSAYAYIFEYFAGENDAILLQQELKQLVPGIETAVCRNCQLPVM